MALGPIPPLGTKGIYVLDSPFDSAIQVKELYECAAVRTFIDLENNGSNIFKTYYAPYGLLESDFIRDRDQGHILITLVSPKYPPVYVPSSYLKTFPSIVSKKYNQVILSLSLGAVPDDVILEPTIQAIQSVVSDHIGVTVNINVGVMPLTDAVSQEEHLILEAARQGAITVRETDYARVHDLTDQNTALVEQIALLEQIIKDNGLLD